MIKTYTDCINNLRFITKIALYNASERDKASILNVEREVENKLYRELLFYKAMKKYSNHISRNGNKIIITVPDVKNVTEHNAEARFFAQGLEYRYKGAKRK